mgnify:CR=1 FL=1
MFLSRLLGDNKHRNVPNKLIQQDIHHRKRVCGVLVQQVEHDQHTEQAGERAERQRRADGARQLIRAAEHLHERTGNPRG